MSFDIRDHDTLDRAMESVLLLYYHLNEDGGITNDQTVYLNEDSFDGFSFIDIDISSDLDQKIYESTIKDGAVIYLVCDLNDYLCEYEDDYLYQEPVKKIISKLAKNSKTDYLEVAELIEVITKNGVEYDYDAYKNLLNKIYEKYVSKSRGE